VTVLEPQPPGIPAPVPGPHSEPYWDGCRQGELRFLRCDGCAAAQPKPTMLCRRCRGRSLSWTPSGGRGVLYSWTVVWRPQHPTFRVPYAPAIVDLDEGFSVLSAVVGCRPEDLAVDLAVAVEFHAISETITLPYFRPVTD